MAAGGVPDGPRPGQALAHSATVRILDRQSWLSLCSSRFGLAVCACDSLLPALFAKGAWYNPLCWPRSAGREAM